MKLNTQRRPFLHEIAYRVCCLLVMASLLLSACQASTPADGSTPAATDGQTTAPQPSAASDDTPANGGEITSDADEHPVLTFSLSEWERSRYEPLVEQFNAEHPEITVQLAIMEYGGEEVQSAGDYYYAQASSGDTFIVSGVTYIPQGYLRDLQPMIETDVTFDAGDFWNGALEACQDSEGRQLGVPLSINLNGIFYDQEAFDAAGLPYPQPGWTLDDFRKAITALAKKDGDEIRYGFAQQYGISLEPYLEAVLDANDGEVNIEAIQALTQWYVELIKSEAIYTPPYVEPEEQENYDWNKQWQDWQALFQNENRPAMWAGSISEMMPGTDYVMASDGQDPLVGMAIKEDGFAPFPVMSDGSNDNTNTAWAQCVAISAGSKNPRAAWEWVSFLSHQAPTTDDTSAWERLQLPMRMSLADSSGYWNILPEGMEETIRYMVEHSKFDSAYPEVIPVLSTAIQRAAGGDADLATALKEAEEQAKNTLESALLMTQEAPAAAANTTPIVVATPKPTLSADMTEVTYFNQSWGPDREALQAIVDQYNKSLHGTTITLRSEFNYAGQDFVNDMAQEFDCFTWYPAFYTGSDNAPDLLPLDALVQAEGPEFLQDFDSNLVESFRQDGALIGLPAFSQPQIMAYNADLLAKRGVEFPKSDWSFDDFIAMAAQASSSDEADRSYGLVISQWDNLLFSGRGIEGFDARSDPPVALFDSPEFASGLAWIEELFKAGTLLVDTNDNYMDIQEAMQEGKVAFWTSQAGQPEGWYFNEEEPAYKIGIAPMPAIDDPASSYIYWGNNQAHYISAQTENQQACWDWIKYLSAQPTAFSGVPARKSVAASSEWEASVGQEYAAVYRLALSQMQLYTEEEIDQLFNIITGPFSTWQSEIMAALLKGENYTALIPQTQQKAEDYLACMASVDTESLEDEALQKEIARCAKQADPNGNWGVPDGE